MNHIVAAPQINSNLKHTKRKKMGLQLDPSFIQEGPHRPNTTIIQAKNIPIIDLSPILSTGGDHIPDALIKEVEDACRDWGFFQVVNHGVPLEKLEAVKKAGKEFFELPMDEKMKTRRDEHNPAGYYNGENTKNVRDWKEVFDFMVAEPMYFPVTSEPGESGVYEIMNRWPEYPLGFREACHEYRKAVEELQYKLLKLISLSLGLPPNRLDEYVASDDTTSFVRINRYPPCLNPDLVLGVGRHKDAGIFTILAQDDVGGLEVRRKSDDKWVLVDPVPNAYIINIGDVVQVWSNDKYESVDHRVVVNSEKERFSVPFFVNPPHYTMVRTLEEFITEENPAKYVEYSWGQFYKTRLTGNYKKMAVENVQIHHFSKAPKTGGGIDTDSM